MGLAEPKHGLPPEGEKDAVKGTRKALQELYGIKEVEMTTEERLEKLERELSRARKRFRALVVGAGLCLASLVAVYAYGQLQLSFKPRPDAAEESEELRARNFVLEDGKGQVRATLGMYEGTVMLRLHTENGDPGALLYLNDERAGVTLNDNNGKHRAVLAVAQNMPILCLYDEKGEPRASLAVIKDGPRLTMRDDKGQIIPIR
jgi:hypothetical protein